jgi:rod shape-determining protein MreD
MTGMRAAIWIVLVLILGAILNGPLAHRMALFGAAPDLLVIGVACLSLFLGRAAGAVVGFVSGLLMGSLTGEFLGAYAVSRAFGGFVAGWAPRFLLPQLWITGPVVTFLSTLTVDLVFLLIAPQNDLGSWVKLSILRSAYHAGLCVPLYLLLLRSMKTAANR